MRGCTGSNRGQIQVTPTGAAALLAAFRLRPRPLARLSPPRPPPVRSRRPGVPRLTSSLAELADR